MKKNVCLITVVLFLAGIISIHGQEMKKRVGVLDFAAKNASSVESEMIGELFTAELVRSGAFDVIDRRNIESLLKEMDFQMSGCTDTSCAVEVGQILSLEYMISGTLMFLGQSFVINLQMINVGTAQIEQTVTEKFAKIDDSFSALEEAVRKLVLQMQPPEVVGEEITLVETDAASEPDTPPKAPPPKAVRPSGAGWAELSSRKKGGVITFISGLLLSAGGGVLLPVTNTYNTNVVIPAQLAYEAAGETEWEDLRDVYVDVFQTKNIMVISSMGLLGTGGVAVITGLLLWLLPEKAVTETRGPEKLLFYPEITANGLGMHVTY